MLHLVLGVLVTVVHGKLSRQMVERGLRLLSTMQPLSVFVSFLKPQKCNALDISPAQQAVRLVDFVDTIITVIYS